MNIHTRFTRIIAPLLCGFAMLLLSASVRAQIGILNGPSPIEFSTTAATLNNASFTVSSNASVLVVFYGSRTQGDSPGSDPGVPPTISWNGNVLTKAISQGSTASTFDDNGIYYLWNPPPGTGSMTSSTIPASENQIYWMAYTLQHVSTTTPPLTGASFTTSGTSINNTVPSVPTGDWAAYCASVSANSVALAVTTSPTNCTVLPNVYGPTSGNTTQNMGGVSNCPGGSLEFICSAPGQTTAKIVMIEAIFTPSNPPPPAPTLSVVTGNPVQVDLSWTEASNSFATEFIVLRSTNSSGAFTDYTNVLGATVTNFTDKSVLSGQTYYYTVAAANAGGTNFSTTNSVTPAGAPFSPLLGVGASGAGSIALHWTPVFGATNYIVERSTTSGAETQITTSTNNTYTDTGLASGTNYYYEVAAVGAGGTSAPSDEASAVALGSGWHLFDNFSLDTVNSPLNAQTGSAGLGTGWVNLGGGTPITVTNSSTFGGANYAQYTPGSAANIGDYEAGLGIAGTSKAATVFLEFSLPGIVPGVSNIDQTGTNAVAMNFDIDNSSPPGALTGASVTGPSAQFNYDNTSGLGFFRVFSSSTYFVTISPTAQPYVPIPGDVYYFWFVLNAASGTFQVYLANGSESGTNTDSEGLGATPTLMWGTPTATGTGSVITYGFRNVSVGGLAGQPVNYIGTGPGSALGTVPQNEYANIYVDQTSQNLTNPVTGAPPNGAPQILLQPQPVEVYAGETAVFTIVASAGVSFQWQSNGVPLANVGNIAGATNSTLYISNVVAADAANYSCVIKNPTTAAFAASAPASLSLVAPNGAYETDVAAAGPLHFYALNETNNPQTGSAVAYDFAGSDNGVYGANTLNGFSGILGPVPSGGFNGFSATNYAAQFAGSDEPNNITIDSSWNLDTNEVTLTAWINPNTATEPTSTAIVLNRGSGTDVEGLIYNTSTNFTLGYEWNDDPATSSWDSGLLPPAGQWSFVALVVTPTNATLSMMNSNGVSSSTHVYPHVVAPFAGTTMIGDDPGSLAGALTFNGLIDEVGVFNQALSQSTLQGIFTDTSGLSAFPPTNAVFLATTGILYPGFTAVFSSVDEGSVPMSFTWQINGVNLTDGPSAYGVIAGSGTANLIITNLSSGDAGQSYNVTLVTSNAFGSFTSSPPAVLTVQPIGAAENITMSTFEAAGDWTTAGVWNDGVGGQSAELDVLEFPGSTFEILPGAQLRTPTAAVPFTNFPNAQLTVDGDGVFINNPAAGSAMGQIKMKQGESGEVVDFPLLVMAGGQLDNANAGNVVLAGVINVLSNTPIYVDSSGSEGRGFQINSVLEGNGTIEYHDYDSSFIGGLNIASTNNSNFTGKWNIVQGPLIGSGSNSLGTNSITIGANGALETSYPINNPNGSLFLSGQMFLTQTDTFYSVLLGGNALLPGTYSAASLSASYPNYFPATFPALQGASATSASGQLTVLAIAPAIISLNPTPAAISVFPTQSATFSAGGSGYPPLTNHWLFNMTNVLTDRTNADGSIISGSQTTTLTISEITTNEAGSYYYEVSSAYGGSVSAPGVLTVLPTFPAENIQLSIFEVAGDDWNTVGVWADGQGGLPASTSALEFPGSTYEVLPGALLRTPGAGAPYPSFPGVQLTIDGNGVFTNNAGNIAGLPIGELRFKEATSGITNYFPLLIMAGGQLDIGVAGVTEILGTMDVISNTPMYVDSAGGEGRPYQVDAFLEGNGSIEYHDFDASLTGCLDITCNTNTYTGTWNIVQGPLLGAGVNSLGTNNILISPNGALETLYDIHNPNANLTLGGKMFLHQNDTFKQVQVGSVGLAAGTYTYAQLAAAFPNYFPAAWTNLYGSTVSNASGSITALTSLYLPPFIASQPPANAEEFIGAKITYSVKAGGNPGSYQWYVNGSLISGATGSAYTFVSTAGPNTYYCVVSNALGVVSNTVVTNSAVTPPTPVTFNDPQNWLLQGVNITPSFSGGTPNVLTLTDNNLNEAASAFYEIAQYIKGFEASFTYTPGGSLAADGITFTIQNAAAGAASLGLGGGDLGYTDITNSAAFELNIYTAATGGVGIGFNTNGQIALPYGPVTNAIQSPALSLASGDPINIKLYYSQGVLQATLVDSVTSSAYVTNVTIGDIGAQVGDSVGYIGFTGSDGASVSSQQISNFSFLPAAPAMLTISNSGGGTITISWSGGVLPGFVLQQTSSLTAPWSNVSATPTLVGSRYQVVLAPGAGPQYYRLELP